MKKIEITKPYLIAQYWKKEKTLMQIANECGESGSYVVRAMKRFGIARRDISSALSLKLNNLITKEFLETEYIDRKKSVCQIARELNKSPKFVRRKLVKYNIQERVNKSFKNILTKGFLIKEYITNGKPVSEIAKQVNASPSAVVIYLKKHNIKTRAIGTASKFKKTLTKAFLITEYVDKKKTSIQIADEVNCSRATICNYLNKYNIDIRGATGTGVSGKAHPWYVDGKTTKKYYCIDCGKKLKTRNAYKTKRCLKCYRAFSKGKHHPRYVDGRSDLIKSIRSVAENSTWRAEILKRDNYTCQTCGERGGRLEAHHIVSFIKIYKAFMKAHSHLSPVEDKLELAQLAIKWKPFWDITNGTTLCTDCHRAIKGQR